MIIAILNQKGGSGKTTIALNLTRCYTTRDFKALLVDSDHQGSALRWHEQSGGDLIDITCLPMTTLDKDVLKFKDRYDRIIIDGVPSVSPLTICAVKAADLILIPVQPSPFDIWSTEDLVRNVKDRIEMTDGKTKAAFVISRMITGTVIGREIYKVLEKLGLPILKAGTSQRIAYATSLQRGLTVLDDDYKDGEAADEITHILLAIEGIYHGAH